MQCHVISVGGEPGLSVRMTSDLWTSAVGADYAGAMRPTDIQQVGEDLAIKWDNGSESFVRLETLRRCCPCAGCKGEVDVMGKVYRNPDRPLPPAAFELRRITTVGGYAIQPIWGDGHSTGLYSFEYLRKVAGEIGRAHV